MWGVGTTLFKVWSLRLISKVKGEKITHCILHHTILVAQGDLKIKLSDLSKSHSSFAVSPF